MNKNTLITNFNKFMEKKTIPIIPFSSSFPVIFRQPFINYELIILLK